MTVRWTVRAAEPTEQGCARGETEALLHFSCTVRCASFKKAPFVGRQKGLFCWRRVRDSNPRGFWPTAFRVLSPADKSAKASGFFWHYYTPKNARISRAFQKNPCFFWKNRKSSNEMKNRVLERTTERTERTLERTTPQ